MVSVEFTVSIQHSSYCGLDLHPANLFLGVPKEKPWTQEEFEKVCGKPKIVVLEQEDDSTISDHVPRYLVLDALSHDVDASLFKGPFKVADFGLAFRWSDKNPQMSSAGPYITPEFSAHEGIGGAADIWMFGCAIYQLLSGFDLMGTINDPAVKMVHKIMDVLGQPPQWVLEKWKGMFGESAVTVIHEPRYPLAVRVQQIRKGDERLGMKPRLDDFTEEDISVLTELLSFVLQLDPAKRPGIDQVFGHPAMAYFRV
jgi:serine/threonine-protein kinase SRPK3